MSELFISKGLQVGCFLKTIQPLKVNFNHSSQIIMDVFFLEVYLVIHDYIFSKSIFYLFSRT